MKSFPKSVSGSPNNLLSSFRSSSSISKEMSATSTPHQGALCRIEEEDSLAAATYVIDMLLEDGQSHELVFSRQDFDFVQRLFAILDSESRGVVDRATVKEFVTLRCPVFWRRDDDVQRAAADRKISSYSNNRTDDHRHDSPTFDEVWKSVVEGSKMPEMSRRTDEDLMHVELGVEGWMVFCRFIALAQYLEAKRRFSARHLQQTMRHRNAPRGSEFVTVDVPPPEPPAPLSRVQLAKYEQKSKTPLPLPELDLDHCLLAAHDSLRRRGAPLARPQGVVRVSLFGAGKHTKNSTSGSSSKVEFTLTYSKQPDGECEDSNEGIVVRRSMDDMKWLNDTFKNHNVLGGTLCGRILPPFPNSSGKMLSSQFPNDDTLLNSSLKNTTGGAIAAAAAGVGMIKDAAKSMWRSQLSTTHQSHTKPPKSSGKKKQSSSFSLCLPESYYNPNSPSGKARQLERYLNYLIEHPALCSSFPLNTILKASQSGLESAKQSLEECSRLSKEVKDQTPQLDDGKTVIPFASHPTSLSWVRTAAQAAMALQVHGILETTGMQAASARLQHASLPNFEHHAGRNQSWGEEGDGSELVDVAEADENNSTDLTNSFEQGVITVQSELENEVHQTSCSGDGYDLLPLPVPAPERRILSAGIAQHVDTTVVSAGQSGGGESREARFHYGTPSLRNRLPVDDEDADSRSAFLGDISVDEHIDKLREVIGSVDNTLSRCLASSGGIGRARRERLALHLDIVRGFDSWEGLRGKFVSQRALLKGVSGIEHSNEVYEESDIVLIDDVSWQTSLAKSAVKAAEDVRSAVRAARTAENAKAAASAAAFTAQSACDSGDFPSIDEARAAQTRASIAQSHAFHAAVVEHEAKAVKRRATLGLAHDVKGWNVHRKREMLRACIAHARSQHEATRRAVDAWSCLRDGYIGSSVVPPSQTRKAPSPVAVVPREQPSTLSAALPYQTAVAIADNIAASLSVPDFLDSTAPSVVDIRGVDAMNDFGSGDHECPAPPFATSDHDDHCGEDPFSDIASAEVASDSNQPTQEEEEEEATATIYQDLSPHNNGVYGRPIIVAVDHNVLASASSVATPAICATPPRQSEEKIGKTGSLTEEFPFADTLPLVTASPVLESNVVTAGVGGSFEANESSTVGLSRSESRKEASDDHENLSASMQSLVDGLMTWGGQFETDDVLALPTGMAASIAFEESGAMQGPATF